MEELVASARTISRGQFLRGLLARLVRGRRRGRAHDVDHRRDPRGGHGRNSEGPPGHAQDLPARRRLGSAPRRVVHSKNRSPRGPVPLRLSTSTTGPPSSPGTTTATRLSCAGRYSEHGVARSQGPIRRAWSSPSPPRSSGVLAGVDEFAAFEGVPDPVRDRGRGLAALELRRAFLDEGLDALAEVVGRLEHAVGEALELEADVERAVVDVVEHALGHRQGDRR